MSIIPFSPHPLLTIHDPLLLALSKTHKSYLITYASAPGFLESYDHLALVGGAAMEWELMRLAVELFEKDRDEVVVKIRAKAAVKATITPKIEADLFRAHVGALLFDGKEGGIPLAERAWVVPADTSPIQPLVSAHFGSALKSMYTQESVTPSSNPAPSDRMILRPPAPRANSAVELLSGADAILHLHFSRNHLPAPSFEARHVGGPPHRPEFEVEVVDVDGRVLGWGTGGSKREARKMACREACEGLGIDC